MQAYTSFSLLNRILNLCINAVSCFPTYVQISVLPLLRNPRARSDFMFELSGCYSSLLPFVSVHFLYVPCNLLCHNDVIQQQKKSWMYAVHGIYCYRQNNDHTNLWMKIILSCGMITIPFLVWSSVVWHSLSDLVSRSHTPFRKRGKGSGDFRCSRLLTLRKR